jgi:hypothetical protein
MDDYSSIYLVFVVFDSVLLLLSCLFCSVQVKYSESPIWHARLINSDIDVAYALVKTFVGNECMP